LQFLQTVDEMLFFNIDITGSIVAFILVNLAGNLPFQEKLRSEITEQQNQASYDVAEYIIRQDTLLHYVTLESIRVTPAMCECVSAIQGASIIHHEDRLTLFVQRVLTSRVYSGTKGHQWVPSSSKHPCSD
jgi:hypothetical protein